VAFEKAMESVAERYPQDDEAKILYALCLNITALPTDKTFANQLKAAGILERLFKKYPNHPGVAHYLIHTYDYAELAEKGFRRACLCRYCALVPACTAHAFPHFSRVGLCGKWWRATGFPTSLRSELKETTLGIGTYDACTLWTTWCSPPAAAQTKQPRYWR